MKIRTMLLTAGMAIASLGASAGASAQAYNGGDRHQDGYRNDGDRHDQGYRNNDRRDDRRDHHRRDWRGDRGRHNGWNRHQRCWTEWHHHHKVRVCR